MYTLMTGSDRAGYQFPLAHETMEAPALWVTGRLYNRQPLVSDLSLDMPAHAHEWRYSFGWPAKNDAPNQPAITRLSDRISLPR